MKTVRVIAATAVLLFVAACGGEDEPEARPTVPADFEVPAGVTITAGGTTLTEDESATVVYQVGDGAASAITVTVTAVRKGDIEDFKFFSLDDAAKKSTPFYVDLTVENRGPAGIGGVALPVFAHDSENTIYPANELVGDFKPCPNPTLPSSFLPEQKADLCLVYLVPEGRALQSVDLQPGEPRDAIHWTP